MKSKSEILPLDRTDHAAIMQRAQQLRAEAMADIFRAFGGMVKRGWAAVAHRPGKLVH